MTEKTIKIQDKEVRLLYCAATEDGFESLSGKSIYDIDFHQQKDLITLGLCAIIAAYSKTGEEPPVTSDTLLYEARPSELVELVKTVIELRAEWYEIPKVLLSTIEEENRQAEASGEETQKN